MGHVCAKPACVEQVEVWLDFAPATQRVIERVRRTEVSVGLCTAHADRFSVPTGWELDRLPAEAQPLPESTEVVSEETPEASDATTPDGRAVNRRHRRDRPWFLASGRSAPGVDTEAVGDPDRGGDEIVPVEAASTAGPLLQRAFHGPDREADVARAAREHQDELETRRSARSDRSTPEDSGGHGMAELPFPPFDSEHQAAVS